MMRNNSNKVECVALGSLKPGAEPSKGQTKNTKPLFSLGCGASSFGGIFSFGSGGTSQTDAKPVFTFGTSNQRCNSSSGFSFGFGSLKEGGRVSAEQTEDPNKLVPSLHEQLPDKEADNTEGYSEFQEMLKNQTSVKPTQQEQEQKEAKEDLGNPSHSFQWRVLCLTRSYFKKDHRGLTFPTKEPNFEQKC